MSVTAVINNVVNTGSSIIVVATFSNGDCQQFTFEVPTSADQIKSAISAKIAVLNAPETYAESLAALIDTEIA